MQKVTISRGSTMTAYPAAPSTKPVRAVIVCPGGGYGGISAREGAPVAEALNRQGIAAFVLDYPVAPNAHYPQQVFDLATAVKYLRSHATIYNINPKKITVMGFSAGGHLAATLATQWQYDYLYEFMKGDPAEYKPDSVVLCYPVITGGAYAHRGSFENLLGGDMSKLEIVSLERCVSIDCPPVFIWHTVDDTVVPVENSLLFISALRKKNRSFEAHIYPKGEHGLSLSTPAMADGRKELNNKHVASWFNLAVRWIKSL